MTPKPIDLVRVHQLFAYDAEAGTLTRKKSGKNNWSKTSKGYQQVNIDDDGMFLVHRICWAMHHGIDPGDAQVDHKNCNKTDNRASNLRLATGSQNMANKVVRRDNALGLKGVSRNGSGFTVRIKTGGGNEKNLGTFKTAIAAQEAYRQASEEYHGEFARAS